MFSPHQDPDTSIRQTDNDAALAKLSAVNKGYLEDPFIKSFVTRAHAQPPRPPLINVGTYVRTIALDDLVFRWIDAASADKKQCQILSLGAGSDTRFWRLATGPRKDNIRGYFELDFPEVTTKKAMAIRKSKELSAVLPDAKLTGGGTGLQSSVYTLIPCDLRRPPEETMGPHLRTVLSPDLPTLLLFECVLVYMSPTASSGLIKWFTDYFQQRGPLGSIVYEMFGLGDQFGRVMRDNLLSRNVTLPGAEAFPDKTSLPHRFTKLGFTHSRALTLREIRREYLPSGELQRISELELLDEVEELDLVLEHYAITWGSLLQAQASPQWKTWGIEKAVIQGNESDD